METASVSAGRREEDARGGPVLSGGFCHGFTPSLDREVGRPQESADLETRSAVSARGAHLPLLRGFGGLRPRLC